ncbi:DUF4347 domain-containing protein, partial [Cysteiniphilum marinum]|uniref:DUF4347 domain-containing protein n=1 Tax=Cysteiniphilum marinum TaxID=2774191 RepID=UPI00178692C6
MLQLKKSYQKVKGILVSFNKEKSPENNILSYEYPSLLQELEPRFMFDGAAIETVDIADGVSDQEQAYILNAIEQNENAHVTDSLLAALEADPEGFQTDYSQFREVVIIDSRVKDPHILIDSISRDAAIEVVLSHQDGVDRIAEILQKYNGLDALHIVSHGDQAKLYLGDTTLTSNNLINYQTQFSQWGQSLTQSGDILFYGCNVAEGFEGQEFVEQLKSLTDADVAASTDLTGSSDLGGDAIIESRIDIQSKEIINFNNYVHVLASVWTQIGGNIQGDSSGDILGDRAGVAISEDGSRIVVSAPGDDQGASETGTVMVYDWTGANWIQVGADIQAGNTVFDGAQGLSVSISSDGSRIAFGLPGDDGGGANRGSAQVYEYDGTNWIQLGSTIIGVNAGFEVGQSVSLNDDGNRLAIGERRSNNAGADTGSTRLFEYNGSGWVQLGSTIHGEMSNNDAGFSVSLNAAGDRVAIGAPYNDGAGSNAGHVRVYEYNGTNWGQLGLDLDGENGGDLFGYSVALNDSGDRLIAGAKLNDGNGLNSGHARVFDWNGSVWVQLGNDIEGVAANNDAGEAVAISSSGNRIAVAAPFNDGIASNAGHVRIFDWDGASWNLVDVAITGNGQTGSGDLFGSSVALNNDGSRVIIGAPNNDNGGGDAGFVQVYEIDTPAPVIKNEFQQIGNSFDGPNAGDERGPVSLNLDGTIVVSGAPNNDDVFSNGGLVQVHQWDGTAWNQRGSDIYGAEVNDKTGLSVDITPDGNMIVVTAVLPSNINRGVTRVYQWDGSDYVQFGSDILGEGLNDGGSHVAKLSSDGLNVIIGARFNDSNGDDSGHIRVFTWNGTAWVQRGQEFVGDQAFNRWGRDIAISDDGNRILLGSENFDVPAIEAGIARVYHWNGLNWALELQVNGSAYDHLLGFDLSMSGDGNVVAIGSLHADPVGSNSGRILTYEWNGSSWGLRQIINNNELAGDELGSASALSYDGSTLVVSAPFSDGNGVDSGRVLVYQWDGSNWVQSNNHELYGELGSDRFGSYVSLSGDGSVFAVGAPYNDDAGINSGAVYVYTINSTSKIFTEGDVPIVLDNTFALTDTDSALLESAIISITANHTSSEDVLAFTNTGSISGNFDSGTGILTLSGTDTIANYQTALRSVTYENTSGSPSLLTRMIEVKVNDGVNDSNIKQFIVNIVDQPNNPPVNTVIGAQSVNEDTLLSISGLSVTDVDGNLATTRLQVNNGMLNVTLSGGATISSGANGSNDLTISGSEADINVTLASLSYQGNTNFNGSDTLTMTSIDSAGTPLSDVDTVAITVNAVNDEPVVSTTAINPTFTENGTVQTVFSGTAINLVEMADLVKTITLTVNNLQNSVDEKLYIDGQAIDLTNGNSGTTTANSYGFNITESGGTATITLTHASDISVANAQTLIDGLQYENTSENPLGANRVVTLTSLQDSGGIANGGDDTVALSIASTVTLIAVDDPPTVMDTIIQLGSDIVDSNYGRQVSLSADGQIMAVSSWYDDGLGSGGGQLRIYRWDGSDWTIDLANDVINAPLGEWEFADNMQLSEDGQSFIVQLSKFTDAGSARVYEYNGTTWVQKGSDLLGEVSGDRFGHDVSISADGLVVSSSSRSNDGGGSSSGHVRVYEWNGSDWTQRGADIDGFAGDLAGSAHTLSADGLSVAVGAENGGSAGTTSEGSVRIFSWDGSSWVQKGSEIDGDANEDKLGGFGVALNADGTIMAAGAPLNDAVGGNNGQVKVYEFDGTDWVQKGSDIYGEANSDLFGWRVALSGDGLTLAVNAPLNDDGGGSSGHIRLYHWDGNDWVQVHHDIAGLSSGDQFGNGLALSADGKVLAGGADSGSARTFAVIDLDYVENDAATAINDTVTTSDLDSPNLASATITIDSAHYVNGEDILSFTPVGSITGSFDALTGTLTLLGSDTLANYDLALQSVTYQNTSDNPSTNTRIIKFAVNDGTTTSNILSTAIKVTPVNDAPVNTVPGAQSVNEDTSLSISGLSVTDVDGNLATTRLQVTNGTLNITLSGAATISSGANGSNDLTISGSETDINATLASLSYQGNLNFNGSDTLTVTSIDSDGIPLSDVDTVAITINAINDTPVNTVPGAQIVSEDTSLSISGLSVTDSDGNLASTRLQVNNGTLNVTLSGAATISSGSNNSNDLTISGSETDINVTLASLSYQGNLNFNGNDTLTVISNDSAGTPLFDIDLISIIVTPVNDAPVITAGSILNYSENDPAAVIDGGLSISDIDDTHIESATVTISTNYINAEDVLAFVDTANITGSFNSATGVLTLTGSDTVVNYQNALQSITYMNTSDNPSTLSRTVSWVVNDGYSNATSATSIINVSAVNDAPTVSAGAVLNYTAGDTATAIDVGV